MGQQSQSSGVIIGIAAVDAIGQDQAGQPVGVIIIVPELALKRFWISIKRLVVAKGMVKMSMLSRLLLVSKV